MELDEILTEITAGLMGDSEKDIAYLQQQSEKYKDHEYSKEILRACGRLMYDLIPEDKKEEFEQLIENDSKGTEAVIKEIRFTAYEGDFEKALKLSKALVTKIEKVPMFENDAVSEYFTFDNLFEMILYSYNNHSQKDLRKATIPFAEIYYLHGNLLLELRRHAEAKEYLKKALRWNPASCTIAFEYIETFKVEGALDDFYNLTLKQFKYAYQRKDVARCYRNLGFYFVERKEFSVAAACYLVSLLYDKNKMAQSELYYIEHTAPKGYEKPTPELLEKYEKEYGLPRGADANVIGLSHAYSQKALEANNIELAVYFLEIFCGLTEDEKSIKLLAKLKEQLPK